MLGSLAHDRLRRFQMQFIEIETISLSKAANRYKMELPFTIPDQPLQNPFLKRLVTLNLRVFTMKQNSNLFAYGYMLLLTIYDQIMNQFLLNLLKSLLYEESLDLTSITNQPFSKLSNKQLKKLMVQFIFQLQFTDYSKTLLKTLQKYPVILYIMVLFLKTLLVKFGLQEARDYNSSIPTQTAFQMLSQLLDINFRTIQHSYMFLESHCVIYQQSPSLVIIGRYMQSKPSSVSSSAQNNITSNEISQKMQSLKVPSFDRKHHNFNFDSGIRQSLYHDHDAPTPFFNLGSDQRESIPQFKIEKKQNFLQLNPCSSVPQMKHAITVPEDDQISILSSQDNKSFEEKLFLLKNQQNGWKSPIFNNGVILDDVQNAFNAFEVANKEQFYSKNSTQTFANNKGGKNTSSTNFADRNCQCITQIKSKIKIYSKVYQINVQSIIRQTNLAQQNTYDCMIISIKNIFNVNSPSLDHKIELDNKFKRAHTHHQFHATSYYDFDKSFESVEPKSPKIYLNKTYANLNTSYSSKYDSRIKIIDPTNTGRPKIKFTYINKKL